MDADEKTKREQTIEAIYRAIAKVNAGEPYDETCGFCDGKLIVEGVPPGGPYTQWLVHCPCGKSDTVIKGL